MMNPSPTEIVELFSFVEVTLIQYATVAGHFPGVNAASIKPKPKKVSKVEVTADESRREPQANATAPTTPRPKPRKEVKVVARANVDGLNPGLKSENNSAFTSFEEPANGVTNAGMSIR